MFIFQLPAIRGMRTVSFGLACRESGFGWLDRSIWQRNQAGELFAFQKFEGRTTTG